MSVIPLMTREEFQNLLEDSRENLMSHSPVYLDPENPSEQQKSYPFEIDDLYFLYCLTRQVAAVSVMEFGSGWSTLVFAHAVNENRLSMGDSYRIRHPNPFKVMAVEVDDSWMDNTMSLIPSSLQGIIYPCVSPVELVEFQGSFASLYSTLPAFTPDIIYLDGPDAGQVMGSIRGFTSIKRHQPPMSADILLIEPNLWPWTIVVSDGRSANARFLKTRLRRNWQILEDPFGDRTILRLDENPFGPVSHDHITARLRVSYEVFEKQAPFPV